MKISARRAIFLKFYFIYLSFEKMALEAKIFILRHMFNFFLLFPYEKPTIWAKNEISTLKLIFDPLWEF